MLEELRAGVRALGGETPLLSVEGVTAGYGGTPIVHDVELHVSAGQALCLIGPNGAGKSTVLNAIFGFAQVQQGAVTVAGRDVTRLAPDDRLGEARIAYVLQESSVFQDLSVEHNLRLGAYLERREHAVRAAVERIFESYPRLAQRRSLPARGLSGGERRLLEIARALMMQPRVLLLDEPSLGLEPRHMDLVFEMLAELRRSQAIAMVLVEQNARRALGFADVGYVLAAGEIVMAGTGAHLAEDPSVGELYLGAR